MNRAEADELFSTALEHQQAGREQQAQPLYERILAHFPDYPHVPHLLGVIAGGRNDWYYARRLIESSLVTHPADADATANLAWVLFHLGEHAGALTRCEQALALDPRHGRARLTRGLALRELGRNDEALAVFDALLQSQPGMAETWSHRGLALQGLGRHAEALQSFDKALALHPQFAQAHDHRGRMLVLLDRQEEAMQSFRDAIALQPQLADAHFHLGLALQNARRFEEALACYETALRLNPGNAEAWLYRGFALRRLRRIPQDCLASIDRALALKPGYFEALNGRANVFGQLRRHAEAIADYDLAISMRPDFHEAHLNRGHALREMGRPDEAAAAFEETIRLGGDAHSAKFALAAMGRDAPPPIAPPGYIAKLFDGYAERFDEHLVDQLHYQAHERVCELVMRLGPAAGDMLDLGCGTGLCAPLLAPHARSLVGVDLSEKMLEVAARRGLYTALVQEEAVAYLGSPAARQAFDVLISTDVFIYIGDLEPVFAGARTALRPRGLFGFSIETCEGADFVLQATRRYAQSIAYIQRLADAHGFEILGMEPVNLRKEKGKDTPGCVAVLRLL